MADKLETIQTKLDTVVDRVSDIGTKLEVHIAKFDSHTAKQDEHKEALQHNTEVLQANTVSLQDHMARTNLLEKYVKKIDERFTPVELELMRNKAIAEWWKAKVVFLGKLGGAIAGLGALVGIAKWLLSSL